MSTEKVSIPISAACRDDAYHKGQSWRGYLWWRKPRQQALPCTREGAHPLDPIFYVDASPLPRLAAGLTLAVFNETEDFPAPPIFGGVSSCFVHSVVVKSRYE